MKKIKDLIKFYNRESYLIFPILKKIKKKKFNKKIKFSGSLTSYRKKILKKFNLNYKSYGFFINDRKKIISTQFILKKFEMVFFKPYTIY